MNNKKKILTKEEFLLLELFNIMYEYYTDKNNDFENVDEFFRIKLYEILEEYDYLLIK